MSKSPKEAFDKGVRDGIHHGEQAKSGGLAHALSDLFGPSCYRGDKDYPQTYNEGFKKGENIAWGKK